MSILYRVIVVLTIFFWTLNCGSQVELVSTGEVPWFFKETPKGIFVPSEKEWVYKKNKLDKDYFFNNIYTSNMVVFGDPCSIYATELLKSVGGKSNNVYLIRSNSIATISNSEGDIFITTGLISKLDNEAQLLFLLLRECAIIEKKFLPLKVSKSFGANTLDQSIKFLSTYDLELEIEIDRIVWEQVRQLNKYTLYEVYTAFDLLLREKLPFQEPNFEWNYFNSEWCYIPEMEFVKLTDHVPNKFNPELFSPELVKRRNQYKDWKRPKDSISINSHLNSSRLTEIRDLCRFESVMLRATEAQFEVGLFELNILEKQFGKSIRTEKLKSTLWYGILVEATNTVKKREYSPYDRSDSEGSMITKFFVSKSKSAKLALVLRQIHDIYGNNKEEPFIENIYNEMLRLLANSKDFDINKFNKSVTFLKDYRSSLNFQNDDINGDVEKKNIDTLRNFHLFILPDLVSDSSFLKNFNSYVNYSVAKSDTINLKHFYLEEYNRKGLNVNKMEEFNVQNLIENIPISNLNLSIESNEWNVSQYNSLYKLSNSIKQGYHWNRYSNSIISVFGNSVIEMDKAAGTHLILINKHVYQPRIRGIHFLAFTGVMLPYLIPEYFMSGHKTEFAAFYISSENGMMYTMDYQTNSISSNKTALSNSIYQSILSR